MGTGKTAVGQELARQKKRCFVDLDQLIELKEKRVISEIFAKEGEPYFRKVESQTLKEIAREKNFVVACGGGIVINSYNIRLMKASGVIICLGASCEVILKRTVRFNHRPLLNVADPKKQIELLLKLRAPYYARADYTIDTSRLSVKQVADKILKLTSKKLKLKKKKSKVQFKI